MHILLFIFYSFLCIYGIIKIPFIRDSGIRPVWLLLFFALHVLTGLLHNSIAWRYYPEHGDIWNFYRSGFLARHQLIHDPALFLSDNNTLTLFTHNGIIWIYMILNTLSLGSLTINTLLFSFPVFLGNIALFRLFRSRFRNATLAACTVFLLPSTLFWTACIHREAVLYMLVGFLLYSFDRLLIIPPTGIGSDSHPLTSPTASRRQHIFSLISCLLLILYFRFSLLPSLLPALTAWWLTQNRWPRPMLRRLLTATGASLILLFISTLVFPAFYTTLVQSITARQQDFSSLEGHSRLPLPIMNGTWTSIAKTLPAAIRNGLFEPLPGSGGQIIYLAFSFELLAIWLAIIAALAFRVIRPPQAAPARPGNPAFPFTLFCIIFATSGLLLIGGMVPFAGAIVRYRSFFLPFLLAPALYSLHSTPFVRRLDDWLSLHLLVPKIGE